MEFFEIDFDSSFIGGVFIDDEKGGCTPLRTKPTTSVNSLKALELQTNIKSKSVINNVRAKSVVNDKKLRK